ncbi:small heat shock protein, chloroplastic-like [Telopea speciosissima]|uniref:small heat shock protein, chloroplastic-like n=1 Tax=Telopea speciosissima TaxID=54955 RepID=UPI001CC33D2F|nr:small heat shock protein, chloroplastic-like [Telopea speciosissima]
MSSSSLSNVSFSFPFAPERSTGFKLPCIGSQSLLGLTGRRRANNVKAMVAAGEGRDNLDHLQRATKHQTTQQQQQPKRRIAPVAPIGLWDRFPTARTVQQMMETMERMMEDPFAYSSTWPSPSQKEEYRGGRTPWGIKEGENDYKMRFDMPGMTRNDVKVWVEDKMLVVKAEKVLNKKKESEGQTQLEEEEEWPEKSFGRYSSRIALPDNIDFEKVKAEVKDGVLYITIPKASSSSKVWDINVQ